MDDFSWGRALKHGAIAAAVLVVVGIAIVATGTGAADPYQLGGAFARMTFWGFVSGVGFSFILQRRGRSLAIVVATVAVLVGAGGLFRLRGNQARDLSAAESAPLVIDGEGASRRLRHPNLGYSLSLPEDLTPLPAAVMQAFTKMPGVTGTAWGNPAEGRVLVVVLATVQREEDLRDFLKGFEDSESKLAAQVNVDPVAIVVKRNEVFWSGHRGQAHRYTTMGPLFTRLDAFAAPFVRGRVLTVGLYTVSRGSDSFADLASTLTIP